MSQSSEFTEERVLEALNTLYSPNASVNIIQEANKFLEEFQKKVSDFFFSF